MFVVLLAVALASPEGGRAGAATCDITPPSGYAMWGRRTTRCGLSWGDRQTTGSCFSDRVRLAPFSLWLASTWAVLRLAKRCRHRKSRSRSRRRDGIPGCLPHAPRADSRIRHLANCEKFLRSRTRTEICALIGSAVADLRPARLAIGSKESALNRNRHTA
jgi:hypothetical protein